MEIAIIFAVWWFIGSLSILIGTIQTIREITIADIFGVIFGGLFGIIAFVYLLKENGFFDIIIWRKK